MERQFTHPVERMKPQRGRRLDLPAPVMVVPLPEEKRSRLQVAAVAAMASGVAITLCAIAAQAF